MNFLNIIILAMLFLGCKNNNLEKIKIVEKENNKNIEVFFSEKMNQFWTLSIPITFKITNDYNSNIKLVDYKYKYGYKGTHAKVLKNQNNAYIKINDKLDVNPNTSETITVFSKHFIDTTQFKMNYFSSLKKENFKIKLNNFKRTYTDLYKNTFIKDSIFFTFFNTKTDEFINKKVAIV